MIATKSDPTLGWDAVLESCPLCGGRRLTSASPSMPALRICLDCGAVAASPEQRS
jgi:hypothetical protein